jgi:hypothetical protein
MVEMMPGLRTALRELLFELRDADLRLIIGGGYGLYLKREQVRQRGLRTLLREWPEARATNDLDLFLRPELLINPLQLKPLSDALRQLGYQVVRGAEKYQFAKPGPTGGSESSIKIDLLTGPQSRFRDTSAQVDTRRVRPRPSVDLHAHPVDEAVTLEDDLLPINLEGGLADSSNAQAVVYLPHPLTFALMKLFAFRDRVNDENKQYGSYHALDIYGIIATMSEMEWNRALEIRQIHQASDQIKEAGRIAEQYFASMSRQGMVRMRESPYCHDRLQLEEFCGAILELFPIC